MRKFVVVGALISLQACTGSLNFQTVVQGSQAQQQAPLGLPTQHAAVDILSAELTQHASGSQLPPRVAMLCLIHQLAALCKDAPADQATAQHIPAAGSTDFSVSQCL